MTGKLSCENEKQVRRVWLVQFMDALNARGAVGKHAEHRAFVRGLATGRGGL